MRDWYFGTSVGVSWSKRCNSGWTFLWFCDSTFIDADVSSCLMIMRNWLDKINVDLLLELNRCVWTRRLCCSTGTWLVQVLICSIALIHSLWRSGFPSDLELHCSCSWWLLLLGHLIFYCPDFGHRQLMKLGYIVGMFRRCFLLQFHCKVGGFSILYGFSGTRCNLISFGPFLVVALLILNDCAFR